MEVHIIYRDQPSGVEVGDYGKLKQVWDRFSRKNFYYCPHCKGWLEGNIEPMSICDRPVCVRCHQKI